MTSKKENKLIIAVDGSSFESLHWPKGLANYLQHILRELGKQEVYDFHLFGKEFAPEARALCSNNISLHEIKVQSFTWRNDGVRLMSNKYGATLAWFPFHVIPWMPSPIPLVSTVHDLSFITHLKSTNLKTSIYFTVGLVNALLRSTKVITISKATFNDVVRFFPWAKSKLLIAPHGIPEDCLNISQNLAQSRPDSKDTNKQVLFLDAANPRKDLESTIIACDRLHASGLNIRLKATGNVNEVKKRVVKLIGYMPAFINLPGFIGRKELLEEMGNSKALAYLSHGEGFGFPILEAMSLGCSVVCYSSAAEKEVAGECGYYAKPKNIETVIKAIADAIGSSEQRRQAGREHARGFTWAKSADIHFKAFSAQSL